MKDINLIKDAGQYHFTIGEQSTWLSQEDIDHLAEILNDEIADAFFDAQIKSLEITYCIKFLRKIAEEYSGKTIDNIIQQLEARLKESLKGK